MNAVEDEEWIYYAAKHPEEELPGAKWIETKHGPRLVVPISKETKVEEK